MLFGSTPEQLAKSYDLEACIANGILKTTKNKFLKTFSVS